MSSTSSAAATSATTSSSAAEGAALANQGQDWETLLYSIYVALLSFVGQFVAFAILRWRLSRVYRPKSYLVAERERVPSPPRGPWQWIVPLFTTPNSVFIEKCGLDAYFFLRFLRMLLKIFIPLSVVILPILLPINKLSGSAQRGADTLGWRNIDANHTNRTWAHLVLAVLAVIWICYVIYKELRGYIRIRQAYLTSPQHRLRASATTVLVSGIPRKWLSVEALDGLYDVFPGGIRNIWINRNFDDLAEKVKERDQTARSLEDAETTLIQTCIKKHKKAEAKKAKEEGRKKKTKAERQDEADKANAQAERIAQGHGVSSGDPHHTPHNLQEVLEEIEGDKRGRDPTSDRLKEKFGHGLGAGLGAVGHGFGALGKMGRQFVGEVTEDLTNTISKVNKTVDQANYLGGFVPDPEALERPISHESRKQPQVFETLQASREAAPSGTAATTTQKVQDSKIEKSSDGPMGSGALMSSGRLSNESSQQPQVSGTPQSSREEAPSDTAATTTQKDQDSKIEDSSDRPVSSGRSMGSGRPTGLRKPGHVAVLDSRGRAVKKQTDQWHVNSRAVAESSPPDRSSEQERRNSHAKKKAWDKMLKNKKTPALPFHSPEPHANEEDEFPLRNLGHPQHPDLNDDPEQGVSKSKWAEKFSWVKFWEKDEEKEKIVYPEAFDKEVAEEDDGEPVWKQYIEPKDRETLREPIFAVSWWPRLPFMGKKIDKIYHLRKELARLNVEIDEDQQNVERFPFMNSAFIQFNHQVAAHMACQTLSHHVPKHMAPRLVEISPTDVLWENMSTKWWERLLRSGVVFGAWVGINFLYAPLVTFTGLLSTLDSLSRQYKWLSWVSDIPDRAKSLVQGLLPPILLSVFLALIPVVLRILVKQQGVPTGNDREMGVQNYYFAFLFIQVFLVVTLSSSLPTFVEDLTNNVQDEAYHLAQNLTKSSNYFFTYLTVQAFSNSASALLQVAILLKWFLWAPLRDSTARQKWTRQTKLKNINWGSFFPPFANFAVIGIVFCIIAPLIMVFNLIVFSLYWVTQRYNTLYVYQFRNDTGGLLFPTAVNQLFVGLYLMELCLVGLFFTQSGTQTAISGTPRAIVMLVVFAGTVVYQWLLNGAFAPLFRYMPITLEDAAVVRDEEFARAQRHKWERLAAKQDGEEEDMEEAMEERERREAEEEERAIEEERRMIRERRRNSNYRSDSYGTENSGPVIMETKPTRDWTGDRWRKVKNVSEPVRHLRKIVKPDARGSDREHVATNLDPQDVRVDEESQQAVGDVLYGGFSDELEDLTPEERDTLIRYSFQHSALRARRPVVWIPRDNLGISDDEIERTMRMSTVETIDEETEKRDKKTNIWISNDGTALDAKGRVVFRKSPPDFANVDLIAL